MHKQYFNKLFYIPKYENRQKKSGWEKRGREKGRNMNGYVSVAHEVMEMESKSFAVMSLSVVQSLTICPVFYKEKITVLEKCNGMRGIKTSCEQPGGGDAQL